VNFIATATIGFDHIDTRYCDSHSIYWVNAPGCNAGSVQQYVASVLANLSIKQNFSLAGKTLGIIGVGHVGKQVEMLAKILGMNTLLNDPPRARSEGSSGFSPIEKVLKEADIITLHVPLNDGGADNTFHLIEESALELVKPGAWLINSSRGEVVDGIALKMALNKGKLAGAVLDVWENEPAIDLQLLNQAFLATPHIAGYSVDGKRNGTIQVVRSLGAHFGFPLSNWQPSDIPEPACPLIRLDCRDHSLERSVCQAVLHTYDVLSDDLRLRSDPNGFENQRANYPIRREFSAYKLKLIHPVNLLKSRFEQLGFHLI
jgi:erythronate-4-phosphate dehydrogenase